MWAHITLTLKKKSLENFLDFQEVSEDQRAKPMKKIFQSWKSKSWIRKTGAAWGQKLSPGDFKNTILLFQTTLVHTWNYVSQVQKSLTHILFLFFLFFQLQQEHTVRNETVLQRWIPNWLAKSGLGTGHFRFISGITASRNEMWDKQVHCMGKFPFPGKLLLSTNSHALQKSGNSVQITTFFI